MEYREKDYPIPGRWQIGYLKFSRCPKSYRTENTEIWFKAFKMYKNGVLPLSGGWLNQPNKYIEIMDFIDDEIRKYTKDLEEKNARK